MDIDREINKILARLDNPAPAPTSNMEERVRQFLVSLPDFGPAWRNCPVMANLLRSTGSYVYTAWLLDDEDASGDVISMRMPVVAVEVLPTGECVMCPMMPASEVQRIGHRQCPIHGMSPLPSECETIQAHLACLQEVIPLLSEIDERIERSHATAWQKRAFRSALERAAGALYTAVEQAQADRQGRCN